MAPQRVDLHSVTQAAGLQGLELASTTNRVAIFRHAPFASTLALLGR